MTLTALPVAGFELHATRYVIFEAADGTFDVVEQAPDQLGTDTGRTVASFTCPRDATFDRIIAEAKAAL